MKVLLTGSKGQLGQAIIQSKPNGINLDPEINPIWARKNLAGTVLQGGLDPRILLESEEEIVLPSENPYWIKCLRARVWLFPKAAERSL